VIEILRGALHDRRPRDVRLDLAPRGLSLLVLDDVGLHPFLLDLETPADRPLPLPVVDAERLHAEKGFADAAPFRPDYPPGHGLRLVPGKIPGARRPPALQPRV